MGPKKVEAVVSDTIKKENKRITQDNITGKARKIVKDAETWVRNNPGKAAGIAIGATSIGVCVKRGVKKLKDKKKKEEE